MRCCRCFVYFWRRCLFTNWLDIDNHFLVNISIADNLAKFFKINFAGSVFVCEEDCLINDLLQLSVFQVRTNHHFQHLEELTVADVPIIVNIVDSENKNKKLDQNQDFWSLFNWTWILVLQIIKFIFSKGTSMYYVITKKGRGKKMAIFDFLITKGRGSQKAPNLDYIVIRWKNIRQNNHCELWNCFWSNS